MYKILLSILIISVLLPTIIFAKNEKNEASLIVKSGANLNLIINEAGRKKDPNLQTEIMKKYTESFIKGDKKILTKEKYAINNFIVYGTKETAQLGVGKRSELIKLFQKKYKKNPKTQKDWEQVLGMKTKQLEEDNCGLIVAKLAACLPYECRYTDPMLNVSVTKKISGYSDGLCNYEDRLPNKYVVKCAYSEASRKAASEYFKAYMDGRRIETKTHGSLGGVPSTTYLIEGKEIVDFSKDCKVSTGQ